MKLFLQLAGCVVAAGLGLWSYLELIPLYRSRFYNAHPTYWGNAEGLFPPGFYEVLGMIASLAFTSIAIAFAYELVRRRIRR
jgi:hypothetical protein